MRRGNLVLIVQVEFFFFSSRGRHTISLCDWSLDVCSSDLFENTPWVAFSKPLEKISVGGKFVTVYGAGANLIGTGARLVSSVKCSNPSKKLVTREERMNSSSAAPGQPIGLTTMGARFVPGPLVPATPSG